MKKLNEVKKKRKKKNEEIYKGYVKKNGDKLEGMK